MLFDLNDYELFLFDMDGLLVDTEPLHYKAYQKLCEERGYSLPWSFDEYVQIAHSSSTALRTNIYSTFPKLEEEEPDWNVLYAEKKAAYLEVLKGEEIHLMPGVEHLISTLVMNYKQMCVVTHSPKEQADIIRSQHSILNQIPHWITKEDYERAKPDPQCYKLAINKLASKDELVIGFEDSFRGLQALMGSAARAVLVTTVEYDQLKAYEGRYDHISSLEDIFTESE